MIRSALVLLIVLVAFWLMLSGYLHEPVLLILGALSVLTVLGLSARMKIFDAETAPYIHGKALGYYVWLFIEIVKANMTVVKAVLSPDMEVSPKMTAVPMKQSTDLGRVTFANSITLTPGTIAVEMGEDSILVHALLAEMTDAEAFAEMGERAAWAVSDPMMARIDSAASSASPKGDA